jgi:hypothetical protein
VADRHGRDAPGDDAAAAAAACIGQQRVCEHVAYRGYHGLPQRAGSAVLVAAGSTPHRPDGTKGQHLGHDYSAESRVDDQHGGPRADASHAARRVCAGHKRPTGVAEAAEAAGGVGSDDEDVAGVADSRRLLESRGWTNQEGLSCRVPGRASGRQERQSVCKIRCCMQR